MRGLIPEEAMGKDGFVNGYKWRRVVKQNLPFVTRGNRGGHGGAAGCGGAEVWGA